MSEKYSAIIASLIESHILYRQEQEKKLLPENKDSTQRIAQLSQQLADTQSKISKDRQSQNILHGEQIQILTEIIDANQTRLSAVQQELEHIQSTKSWRWTAPYRKLCGALSFPYKAISRTDKQLPPQQTPSGQERLIKHEGPYRKSKVVNVSAVVYCDNAALLKTTIKSLYAQSAIPEKIIILDATGAIQTKDVRPVHSQYQSIHVIRNTWDDDISARNAATPHITSEFTIYLRCGDALNRHCIYQQLHTLADYPDSPFCYGSARYYGKRTSLVHTPNHMNVSYIAQATHIETSTMLFRSTRLKDISWNKNIHEVITRLLGNGYGYKSVGTYFLYSR